jgi:hypothetical protein
MTGEFVCLFMSINYIVIYTFEWLILWYCIIAWSVNFLWIHAEWSVHAYAESWPRKKSSYPEIILCWNNLHEEIKDKIIHNSRKDVKSLTEAYTRNISVVAILMASITFAAAFTVSGWYRRSQEIPITAKKYAYQAFLISDTLAACSSLCVAFICIIARWEDFEFLLYYRFHTKAYVVCIHGNNHSICNWFIHNFGSSSPVVYVHRYYAAWFMSRPEASVSAAWNIQVWSP